MRITCSKLNGKVAPIGKYHSHTSATDRCDLQDSTRLSPDLLGCTLNLSSTQRSIIEKPKSSEMASWGGVSVLMLVSNVGG